MEITSMQSLVDEMNAAKARLEELQAMASDVRELAVTAAIEEINAVVSAHGLSLEDVLSRITPAKQPKREKVNNTKTRGYKPRLVWIDGEGRLYKGGKPPSWMKQAMESAGVVKVADYCQSFMSQAA